jgi:hypothetical protein
MTRLTRRLLLAATIATIGCSGAGPAPRTFAKNIPDVAAHNLAPKDEIDALLTGLSSVGKPGATARVAVAPFKVLGGKGDDWIGEATSEIVAARVSAIENVSVLERSEITRIIDELKRAGDEADHARTVQLGRVVGAQHMILGKVVLSGGDKWTLVVHAVKVENGAWTKAAEVPVARSDISGTVAPAAIALVEALGGSAPPPPASGAPNPADARRPLEPAKLELASKARELQYAGKLVEAQPLYAEALAEPSNAWRFEADYVRLLSDLGLGALGEKHGREVLARMPVSASTACDRARLKLETEGSHADVEEARDTVRTAASCGDDAVTALALRHYAWAVESVSYSLSMAALDRAHDLVEKTSDKWASCWIDFHRYVRQAENGANWQGRRDEHLLPIAQACEVSGNSRRQVRSLQVAAEWTPEAKRKLELYEQTEKAAKIAGGTSVDEAARGISGQLRALGRNTAADQKLLDALGVRINALIELHGGLPSPLDRLDADVLRGAHVEGAKPTTSPPKEPLVAQAHREGTAELLRAWAERTRSESRRQAEFYDSIADELDPPQNKVPANETADARLERVLAASKLPLAKIGESSDAPLRGSGVNVWDAYWALSSWLSNDRTRDDAKHKEVLDAAKKTAAWVDAPRVQRDLLMEEARSLEAKELHPQAIAAAKATMKFVADDPEWTDGELAFEAAVLKKTDAKAMVEVEQKRIEAAKKVSGRAWMYAVYQAAYDAVETREGDAQQGIANLKKCSEELDAAEDYESAAEALRYATFVANLAARRQGSAVSFALMKERVAIVDKLNDEVRSIEARVDAMDAVRAYYAEGFPKRARDYLAKEPYVTSTMADVRKRLDTIVAEGHLRDAARIVARIPVGAEGLPALAQKALEWSDGFKDSVEYPMIAARIWRQRSQLETEKAKQSAAIQTARDFFSKAHDIPSAVNEARWLIRQASTEAELWSSLDACLEIAKPDPNQPDFCIDGFVNAIQDEFGPQRIEDVAKVRAVLQKGKELLKAADTGDENYRIGYRSKLARLAALAGDWEAMAKFDAEIQAYAKRTPNWGYRYGSYLGAMAAMSANRDPKRALDFCEQFDHAHVAAPVWTSTQYIECADFARRAKDKNALEHFEKEGREAAKIANITWLPYYDLNLVKDAVRKKDWKAGAKAYKKAGETVKKFLKPNRFWPGELDAGAAYISLFAKDTLTATSLLDPMVRESERRLKESTKFERPCFDAQIALLDAAAKMAAGQCAEGTRLRELSSRLQTMCKEEVCYPTVESSQWCDAPGRTLPGIPQNACRQPVPVEPANLPYSK